MDERDASIKFSEEAKESNSDFIIEFREASFSWPESMSKKGENSTEQNGHLVIKNGPYKGKKITNSIKRQKNPWKMSCTHLYCLNNRLSDEIYKFYIWALYNK